MRPLLVTCHSSPVCSEASTSQATRRIQKISGHALAGLFAAKADFVDPSAGWAQGNQEIANHLLRVEMPALNGPLLNSGIERFVAPHPDIAFPQLRWE
jgi:hypothetical protein